MNEYPKDINEFRLIADGEHFDVDQYLAVTTLRFDRVWRRGQQKSTYNTNGAEIVLGEGRMIPLPEQESIASGYIKAHRDALRALANYPGVQSLTLSLQYHWPLLEDDVIGFCIGPNPLLMWLALDIGLRLSYSVAIDRSASRAVSATSGSESMRSAKGQPIGKGESGTTGTRPVLVTTAIIVHVPGERQDGFTFLEPYGDKLKQSIEEAFGQTAEVEYPKSIEFREISPDTDENVGRCERCGCWVSDYTQPDFLAGIPAGRRIDGGFLCDECETFGSKPGDVRSVTC